MRALIVLALLLGTQVPPVPVGAIRSSGTTSADRSAAELAADQAGTEATAPAPSRVGPRLQEFERAVACRDAAGQWTKGSADGACPTGADAAQPLDCGAEPFLQPMWRRSRVAETADWGPWGQIDQGRCGLTLPVLSLADFRRLPLAPPVLRLQPDRGWVLVNKETIVMTERVEQTFVTNLLGRDVEVVAAPERFHYAFGDGTDLWTRSAGNPYPNHDTYRVYEQPGTFQITLTTEWSGRYRVAGDDTWHAVTGTAQTSTTSAPFEVVERRSTLVDDLCTDVPKPADC